MGFFSVADQDFLLKILESAPTQKPTEDIAAWVEGRRILPTSSPIPGPWHNAVAPYNIDIMNDLSPNSGVQRVVVMKPRKVGLTTAMENAIAYYMLACPSVILYATASEDLAQDWGDNKIMNVIESLGGLDKITANTTSAKSRRTGNTSDKKEFIGGTLYIMSSQSKRARRQLDVRAIFLDEVDGVTAVTTTGEGKFTEILFGHTAAWGTKRKIALFGSPTVHETSLTHEYWLQGDCRKFLVPCPFCGGKAHVRKYTDWLSFVHCNKCDAERKAETEDKAIAAWNKRANPDFNCSEADTTGDGKCIGYQINSIDDEPHDKCKDCPKSQFYEEANDD
ncbi:MAG: phage terminase large subunit family protein [Treponema sp.]|jgi:Lar family restriction alleviation protein|nr:phage terminase large subunit family protein [Treponema sp.]